MSSPSKVHSFCLSSEFRDPYVLQVIKAKKEQWLMFSTRPVSSRLVLSS
jgi:hypothetical protein